MVSNAFASWARAGRRSGSSGSPGAVARSTSHAPAGAELAHRGLGELLGELVVGTERRTNALGDLAGGFATAAGVMQFQ
jgi:hypothetical protein